MSSEHMKRWKDGCPRSWAELNGCEASMLIFPDSGKVYSREKGQGGPILCHVQQYCDAGDFMVFMVEHDASGKETARHNVNFIESILWS